MEEEAFAFVNDVSQCIERYSKLNGTPPRIGDLTNARWGSVPKVHLHWRVWGDECVVYNAASGHTHLLDPVAGLLVQQVTERLYGTTELLQQVAAVLDVETTEEFQQTIQQTLWKLDDLGLIEAVIS